MRTVLLALLVPILIAGEVAPGERLDATSTAAREMAAAAISLLRTLTPEQRTQAALPFADAKRKQWDFVPRARSGLAIKDMAPEQRLLLMSFLSSGLSRDGFRTALVIMSLDAVLLRLKDNVGMRDAENFLILVFGDPAKDGAWGWRFEGHHLSLSLTVTGSTVSCTPTFFGSNPNVVPAGDLRGGERALPMEEDLGRGLIAALDDAQRTAARIADTVPGDLGPGMPKGKLPEAPLGIPAAKLTPAQRDLLLAMVAAYADRWRGEFARPAVERVRAAGIEKIHLAYAGSHEPGKALYYRLHGPQILIEFDQQNGNLNHIHAVWRETGNDFGDELLKHYHLSHPGEAAPAR